MKLRDYARQQGVRYETAWRWFRDGKIAGHRVGKQTILVDEEKSGTSSPPERVAIYARVSSAENKPNLDSQAESFLASTSIVLEAGGIVSDEKGNPLRPIHNLSEGYSLVIAGTRELHEEILQRIAQSQTG